MFIEYLPAILTLSMVNLLGVISPGPDFAIVVRNSLAYSRKTGLLTTVGIAFGTLLHISYILLGLGLIIMHHPWVLSVIQGVGGCYLLYIGYKAIRSGKNNMRFNAGHRQDISAIAALTNGFLTNALNPKAALFFLSLFSILINSNTPFIIMAFYGLIIFITTLIWFSLVAFFLSKEQIRAKFNAVIHWVERLTGGILIFIGIRYLFSLKF